MSTYRVVVLTVGRDCEAKWSKPEIKPVVVAQALYIGLLSIVHSVARGGLNISAAPRVMARAAGQQSVRASECYDTHELVFSD